MQSRFSNYVSQHPLRANLVVFTFTILVLLLLAEVAFRVNGKYATFNEKYGLPYHSLFATEHKSWYHVYPAHQVTSQTLKEYSYSLLANNEGLLDKDFTVEKKPRTYRIMVIGDSFVQGMGAGPDSTMPKQLEAILKKEFADDLDIEVWNCGIGNSDPCFEYMLFANRLLKYKPDYVVEVVNFTDINDIILRGGFKRFNADSTITYNRPPWFEPIYAKSYLARRIVHDVLEYNWLFLKPKQEIEARKSSAMLIDSVLTAFQAICTAHHVPFMAAFHPSNYELTEKAEYSMQSIISYCDSTHIPYTDIRACLISEGWGGNKAQLLYWPLDGHCNANGYAHFAQCLSAPLINNINSVVRQAITEAMPANGR